MFSRPNRILVVDDELLIRRVFKGILETASYLVDDAADLAHARRLIALHEYDVVLTDYLLPDGNGESLIREVRARSPHVSCVMMSGDYEMECASFSANVRALAKPIGGELLLQTVAELLPLVSA